MEERISDHISYAEATRSETARRYGVCNAPNEQQLEAMRLAAINVFEPLREYVREPILVNSFFRSRELNDLLPGSSARSQHLTGEAMDIQAPAGASYTNADLFYYIKNKLDYDQLIWEFGDAVNPAWVHVSWKPINRRRQLLRAAKRDGKTMYSPFL